MLLVLRCVDGYSSPAVQTTRMPMKFTNDIPDMLAKTYA